MPAPGILEMNGAYDYNKGGITTQELVLVRAEAAARLGNVAKALADLNLLRSKRFTTASFVKLESTDKNEVLNWVLNERRIELAFLGHRLADIKRLTLEGRKFQIKRGDKTYEGNSPLLVYPIPAKNMSVNPNLVQNPR